MRAFQAPKAGAAAAAGIRFGKHQDEVLSDALQRLHALKSLQDTPSDGIVGKARELTELLFEELPAAGAELRPAVGWKGGQRLSLDLQGLVPKEGGTASEAWKDIPLVAVKALSQELLRRYDGVNERVNGTLEICSAGAGFFFPTAGHDRNRLYWAAVELGTKTNNFHCAESRQRLSRLRSGSSCTRGGGHSGGTNMSWKRPRAR